MKNKNINIGIDLGTTNSEVSINDSGKIHTVKNIFGDEYTPSVFGVDKAKNKIVGKKSYERLYKDTSFEEVQNNKAEIKRLMGVSENIEFSRLNKSFSPEEISAEILKNLKEDIVRKYPDLDVSSAVITIPASFSVLQSEATKKAGKLAGFDHVVLLQEPIAAAVAYGFGSAKKENWLVYDFGGGTFDVAVISSKDGRLSVLGHEGNNFLGGKNLDWAIVDKFIVPEITKSFKVNDFNRNNKKLENTFVKLKYFSENAKTQLSQVDNVNIEIENIGNDEEGKEIYLSLMLSKKEFEKIIKEFINESISLSKKVIKDTGLKSSNIKKIILVGGPTQMEYLKNRLEKDLGIEIDTSQDPLTAVSRGACLYGLTQTIPDEILKKNYQIPKGAIEIDLHYDSLTSEIEECVSGKVEKLKDATGGEYFLQIQSESGSYASNKLDLKRGKFFENISLDKNKRNVFHLYLFDKNGKQLKISPEEFSVTHGISVQGAPIPHSIGIVILSRSSINFQAEEEVVRLFDKNSILPLSKTESFKTSRKLDKNSKDNPLWIKIVEGESNIPDRNTYVCELGIDGKDLPYDLPSGEDIEIKVDINESREVSVTAYIPSIDLTLNARSTEKDEKIDAIKLTEELEMQKERINFISNNTSSREVDEFKRKANSIASSLSNIQYDEDEKRKTNKELKDLKSSIDSMEQSKGIDWSRKEYENQLENAEDILNKLNSEDKEVFEKELEEIKKDANDALAEGDMDRMINVNQTLISLIFKIIGSTTGGMLQIIKSLFTRHPELMKNPEGKYYLGKAANAAEVGDKEEMGRVYKKILELLPKDVRDGESAKLSGITR